MNILRTLIIIALGCLAQDVFGHETDFHRKLTEAAVNRSTLALDASLLQGMGFKAWNDTTAKYVQAPGMTPGLANSALDLIADGSEWEDNQYALVALNHFFDPQWLENGKASVGSGLYMFDTVLGVDSPSWILEDLGIAHNAGKEQQFSYRRAQQEFYSALAGREPSTRFQSFSRTLQMLGHVVHHLQDMAQPQHVRNDQHLHMGETFNPDWSFYERHTRTSSEARTAISMPYPIPIMPTARHFFHTVPASSADQNRYFIGMAEFTARNFVSCARR